SGVPTEHGLHSAPPHSSYGILANAVKNKIVNTEEWKEKREQKIQQLWKPTPGSGTIMRRQRSFPAMATWLSTLRDLLEKLGRGPLSGTLCCRPEEASHLRC
ncbi:mCG1026283, partial [Mus musculus]